MKNGLSGKKLPNVIVLTFPKTGSTSLYHTFAQHPDICLPNAKETWFFDQCWDNGIKWYEDKFLHCSTERVRCDFVSTLMYKEGFAEKLKEAVPDAKFIVLLRDPLKRCFSHYLHEVRRGDEKESFDQAIGLEEDRIASIPAKYSHIAYRDIGRIYKLRIDELTAAFPPERIHFVLLEEIIFSPVHLEKLWAYMGLSASIGNFERCNTARMPRNRTIQKILGLPQTLFSMIQSSSLLNSFVPSSAKHGTRKFRGKVSSMLSWVSEISYKELERTEMPEYLINDLAACYNENLRGLDKLMAKDLSEFWPWYESE